MRAVDSNEPIDDLESRATLIKDGVFIFAMIIIFAIAFIILGNQDHPVERDSVPTDTLYVKSEPGKRTIIIVHD
jgi:hypothetical protein